MNIRSIKRRTAVALCILAVAAIALAAVGAVRFWRTPVAGVVGTSPEGAGESQGGGASTPTADEVAKMVAKSKAVVVGAVVSNECRLSPNKENVLTLYQVEVKEVLKGNLKPGDTAAVEMPGGLVLLRQDGSEVHKGNPLKGLKKDEVVTVSVTPPGEAVIPLSGVAAAKVETPFERQPMVNGQTYLLFLVDKGRDGFRLTSGVQGTASGLQGATDYAVAASQPGFLENVRLSASGEKIK